MFRAQHQKQTLSCANLAQYGVFAVETSGSHLGGERPDPVSINPTLVTILCVVMRKLAQCACRGCVTPCENHGVENLDSKGTSSQINRVLVAR